MEPGWLLDRLVAEKVMGFTLKKEDCNSFWVEEDGAEPGYECNFSTDIAAAWEVVKKLDQRFCLIKEDSNSNGRPYKAWFTGYAVRYGESAPHAICLAALKAMGVTI